jgi:hypothetical protein
MTLRLRPLATLTIVISQHTRIDGLPAHARVIGEAQSCELLGDRVRASQAGGSSDWLTVHADGSVSVDARLLLATPTGSHLTVSYRGRAENMPATGAPVYITPTFETDDPQLRWLNHVQAVGKGVRDGTTLSYDLYELE